MNRLEREAEKMAIETPCTLEEAQKRVMRARLMAAQTIYALKTFIELEHQMVMRGITFSGGTSSDFYTDNLKLQFFGMAFK